MATPQLQVSDIETTLPRCDRGLGKLISSLTSAELIDGVRLQAASIFPDDRGYFLEIARSRLGPIQGFDPNTVQVSAALSYPGTIKAFHVHRKQTDFWCPILGMFQVALVDLREGSSTFGLRNTLYVGTLRTWQILIPPGVGHGYKVIGTDPALLVYLTNRFYDPADEGRIPYDEPGINYDWDVQYK
jgi:dTDP-4-dehydrorhamnose 3,5-epimerase